MRGSDATGQKEFPTSSSWKLTASPRPPKARFARGLLIQPDAAQEVGEAGIGAQAVESRVNLEFDQS